MNLQFQAVFGVRHQDSQHLIEKTDFNADIQQISFHRSQLSNAANLPSYCVFAHVVYE